MRGGVWGLTMTEADWQNGTRPTAMLLSVRDPAPTKDDEPDGQGRPRGFGLSQVWGPESGSAIVAHDNNPKRQPRGRKQVAEGEQARLITATNQQKPQ
ncbi:MAG: hypothetical protein JWO38_4415 [Gemmataceae bacterium]|nr:hypothetical protein [Gemmataceae bacterium]